MLYYNGQYVYYRLYTDWGWGEILLLLCRLLGYRNFMSWTELDGS